MNSLVTIMLVLAGLGALAVAAYCYKKKMYIWLPRYTADAVRNLASVGRRPVGVTDIMFLFVDHFELAGKKDRLDAWMNHYPDLVRGHRDADGCVPQHTWFYALDLLHEHEVENIGQLVDDGLGEIELHWHHDHDDERSFTEKLRKGMAVFHRHGHMLPYRADRSASFAFIHGNWSLDNSRGAQFCGVDNEIEVLLREGCYADFTYPALFNDGQPSVTNQIHYATDNGKRKSYDVGRKSTVGRPADDNELMLLQGPLVINWRDWRFRWHPTIEDGDINAGATHNIAARIDSWIRRGIHVKGQPNWRFVKVFCHGAQDHKSVLGNSTDEMHTYLEKNFNDGSQYRLHYVSARESYNIIRAAEDGKTGDPSEYRDYIIPPPADRRLARIDSAHAVTIQG